MTPLTISNYSMNMKWQNFQVHLAVEMSKLLKKESMVDVTLKADGGESFQAHRIILSACSPFFQEILSPIDHDCHPIIILADVSAYDVKSILEFMYFGEIRVENTNITSVLKTAEDLKIEALVDIKNYLIQNPITSTENNEIDITVKTVPNTISTYPEVLEAKNTGFLEQPSIPLLDSFRKEHESRSKNQSTRLFEEPSVPLQTAPKKGTEAIHTLKKPEQTKLFQPSVPLHDPLRKGLCQDKLPLPSSKSTLSNHPLSKSNFCHKPISPIPTEFLLESHSPLRCNLKKPVSLLESSKSNSILRSSSFSSIDSPSWPLCLSKSIDYTDATSISFDNVISKPLVEIQAPETLVNNEKFNHKDGSQFLAFEGFHTSLKSECHLKEETCNNGAVIRPAILNEQNTEIHVVQYEDLEGEILKNEEPLSPWLILKPPKSEETESFKENIDQTYQKNAQICIVKPDNIFTQTVNDSTPVPKAQQSIPTIVSTATPLTPSTTSLPTTATISKTTLSSGKVLYHLEPLTKQELLHQAVQDVVLNKKSISECASTYNLPHSTLYYRVRSSGVYGKNSSPNLITSKKNSTNMEAAIQLVKEGATLMEACDSYNVTKTGLWRKVTKELGPGALTLRSQMKSKYSQAAYNEAHIELMNGVNLVRISKKYNIPPATLHRIQNKLIDLGHLNKEKNVVPRYEKDYMKWRKLQQAVKAVKEGRYSATQAANVFKIPKATLWRKLKFPKDISVVELNMDSLDMEQEDDDGDDQVYHTFSNDDEEATGEELMMMDEYSLQDDDHYILEEDDDDDSGSRDNNLISEENQSDDQSYIFKTEMDEDQPTTSYYIGSNDMCLKI